MSVLYGWVWRHERETENAERSGSLVPGVNLEHESTTGWGENATRNREGEGRNGVVVVVEVVMDARSWMSQRGS